MPKVFIIGSKIAVSAEGTGEIKLDSPVELDFKGWGITIKSTGAFEIVEITDSKGNSYLKGTITGEQLHKMNDAGFLTGLLDIAAKDYRNFKVKDISGATNIIYIAIVGSVE